ncbi:anti-sigma factor [Solitalea lacus]|uniref:anti-sigma factor n=1 Tax=Solitalea lacus TaxID=2911172 RepID=UPI001ED9D622|nr:anti-sigma factor [Solitalea lacus]UKJ08336.1 anti-sigma factor [Solitalea lacus]
MDVKEYIESGILETYVYGALSEAEAQEVLTLAARYPEIAEELAKIEENFESTSLAMGMEPNPVVKQQILEQISVHKSEKPEIPLYPTRLFAYGMAACLTLLLVSSIAAFTYWERWQSSEQLLVAERETNTKTAADMASMKADMNTYKGVLHNPDIIKIHLASTPSFPGNGVMVYWNAKNADVMIDMLNLPENDNNHQYQLWALVNGKPVDAGVFDVKKGEKTMFKMKDIKGAQAFAITLEPRGGSPNPTMEKMYVKGNI